RAPRGCAVALRLVAVRGHHVPLADRRDLGQRPHGVGRERAGRRGRRAAPGVRTLSTARATRPRRCAAIGACIAAIAAAACLAAPPALGPAQLAPAQAAADNRIVFPDSVPQGSMVLGKVPPGSRVEYAGRVLRTTGYGTVVFGIGRDVRETVRVAVTRP